jgi:hypothetical protein
VGDRSPVPGAATHHAIGAGKLRAWLTENAQVVAGLAACRWSAPGCP